MPTPRCGPRHTRARCHGSIAVADRCCMRCPCAEATPGSRLLEHGVEHLGLGHRAREAVQDEAVAALGLLHGVGDDPHNDVVGDERARVHRRLGLLPHRSPLGHRSTQHVTRGQVAEAVVLLDDGRLRALPATGRPCKRRLGERISPVWPRLAGADRPPSSIARNRGRRARPGASHLSE